MNNKLRHEQFGWLTEDGIKIFAQLWTPSNGAKAVICLVHGLGEHSSRYKVLPSLLVNNGYAFVAYDQRGHGNSEGKRGHTPSYDMLLDDISRLLKEAACRFPGRPLYLYGHSMGGNLVLNYALRRKPEIKGVIVTGPWLKLTHPPKPLAIKFAKVLSKIWPSFKLRNGIKSGDLSHKEQASVKTEKDELMHPWITASTFTGVHEAGSYALETAHSFKYPLLIMHGGSDNVTHPEGSRSFSSALNDCVTLKIWEGLYHEIHNEPRNDEIFSYLIEWLDQFN